MGRRAVRDKPASLRGGSIEKAAAAVKEIQQDLTNLPASRPKRLEWVSGLRIATGLAEVSAKVGEVAAGHAVQTPAA